MHKPISALKQISKFIAQPKSICDAYKLTVSIGHYVIIFSLIIYSHGHHISKLQGATVVLFFLFVGPFVKATTAVALAIAMNRTKLRNQHQALQMALEGLALDSSMLRARCIRCMEELLDSDCALSLPVTNQRIIALSKTLMTSGVEAEFPLFVTRTLPVLAASGHVWAAGPLKRLAQSATNEQIRQLALNSLQEWVSNYKENKAKGVLVRPLQFSDANSNIELLRPLQPEYDSQLRKQERIDKELLCDLFQGPSDPDRDNLSQQPGA